MLPRTAEVIVQIIARLAWPDAGWGTPLVNALAGGTLPPDIAPPALFDFAARAARPDADPAFLAALALETPTARAAAWAPLQAPGARVVVTGQQPGCAGGALLVLYKAATAVALARRAAAVLHRPVVPVFWNGTDDEDFEEIARIGWPAGARGLEFLELPRAGRHAAAWVGDLAVAGDLAAVEHMRTSLAAPRRAALEAFLPRAAADHGEWVGALVAMVFPEMAVLDARSAALRRYGAPLFARYLAHRNAAPEVLQKSSEAVRAAGFVPTLAPESAARALYLTPERHRQKLAGDAQPLEQAVAAHPEHVSPSVVLRALLQDAVLPVVAQVVGPAEVAYLLELRGLRQLLQVPEPALAVRASCTLLDSAGWAAASAVGLGPETLVRDPEDALQRLARSRSPRDALAVAFATLDASLAGFVLGAGARERAARRLGAVRDELGGELDALARAVLVAAHPELAALPGLLRPRGRAQERLVAGLWALAYWGEGSRETLLQLADLHLEALAEGRGEHFVVML